jgi:predicted metal-dependent enzyme (double-stranded beta helix superfamily)
MEAAMTEQTYSIEQYAADLRKIEKECSSEDEIISRVAPLAQKLALDKSWVRPEHYETDREQGFGVHLLHEEADHSLPVFVVSWLPGRGAPPHDHGTWAVVAGVEGVEKNTRYKRIDDRSRDDYAELEVKEAFDAAEGELVCMKTGGIHSVMNESEKVTLSLHTYGMHVNHTERSQFNLATNEKKDFKVQVG